jgi:hypothetical protein
MSLGSFVSDRLLCLSAEFVGMQQRVLSLLAATALLLGACREAESFSAGFHPASIRALGSPLTMHSPMIAGLCSSSCGASRQALFLRPGVNPRRGAGALRMSEEKEGEGKSVDAPAPATDSKSKDSECLPLTPPHSAPLPLIFLCLSHHPLSHIHPARHCVLSPPHMSVLQSPHPQHVDVPRISISPDDDDDDDAGVGTLDEAQRKFKAAALRKEAIDIDGEV